MTATQREDSGTSDDSRGGAFFDDAAVFDRYVQLHGAAADPSNVMEEPAVLEEIGSAVGLRVVDLGCGDAAIGRALLHAGCRRYLGIDGSANMVDAARTTLADTSGEAIVGDIEDFGQEPESFDLVISRLALHYVEDLGRLLRACRACLAPGGRVVFTVVHPIVTSHDARASADDLPTHWVVDDYFVGGPRRQNWLGGSVVWHHRTIEEHVAALHSAGFALTALRECPPRRERVADPDEFTRQTRVPMFLLLAGTRA